jgi:hypothetical protein
MSNVAVIAPSRFADRVLRLLERVEHRRAESVEDREAIFRLRYTAYQRERLIGSLPGDLLYDEAYDDTSNCFNFGTYIDGELASTMRVHVALSASDVLPSSGVFGDLIVPRLEAGNVVVDPTRFATKLEFSRRFPEMPYLTVRPGWLAGEHFHTDYILATMRSEHQAYYKRVFGHVPWSGEREYPRVNCKIVCMGMDYQAQKSRVEERYPFFRSSGAEREMLFGRAPEIATLVGSGEVKHGDKLYARS